MQIAQKITDAFNRVLHPQPARSVREMVDGQAQKVVDASAKVERRADRFGDLIADMRRGSPKGRRKK